MTGFQLLSYCRKIWNCRLLQTLYQLFTTIVVLSLFCFCTLVAYIANKMDPDQAAPIGAVWSEFIVFAFMIKSSEVWSAFKYM